MIAYKLTIAFLSLLITSCKSNETIAVSKEPVEHLTQEQMQEHKIKIASASYQNWVAGVRGGGSGINFFLDLSAPLTDAIKIKKLQFKSYEITTFDTINDLQYVFRIKTDANQRPSTTNENHEEAVTKHNNPNISIPEGEAVLFFQIKGKMYTTTIKNVTQKEMLAYPSVKRPTN